MRIDKSVWHMCGSARIWAPIGLWQWHLCHTGVQGMRANKFQHAATRCNTLQHAATRYNTRLSSDALLAVPPVSYGCAGCESEQPATHCDPLQHVATRCNTLQHSATHSQLRCAVGGAICVTRVCRNVRIDIRYHALVHARFSDTLHICVCERGSLEYTNTFWQPTHLCEGGGGR